MIKPGKSENVANASQTTNLSKAKSEKANEEESNAQKTKEECKVEISELLETNKVPGSLEYTIDEFTLIYPTKRAYKFTPMDEFSLLIAVYTRCFFDDLVKRPLDYIKEFMEKIKHNLYKKKHWTIQHNDASTTIEFLNELKRIIEQYTSQMKENQLKAEGLKEWPEDTIECCMPFIENSLERYISHTKDKKGKKNIKKNIPKLQTSMNKLFELDIVWIHDKEDKENKDDNTVKKPIGKYIAHFIDEKNLEVFYRNTKVNDETILLHTVFNCLAKALEARDCSNNAKFIKNNLIYTGSLHLAGITKTIFDDFSKKCLHLLPDQDSEAKTANGSNAISVHKNEEENPAKMSVKSNSKKKDIIQIDNGICMLCMRTDKSLSMAQTKCIAKCELPFCEKCKSKVNEMLSSCPKCFEYGLTIINN